MIDREEYVTTVNQHADGAPWNISEPGRKKIAYLPDGSPFQESQLLAREMIVATPMPRNREVLLGMATPRIPTSRKRILYVEDDPDSCSLLRILLRRHDVSIAATMSEALEKTRHECFDLYVLDGVYPDGTGVELCRQLRASDDFTPVLFFSGQSNGSDILEAMSAGAQAYLIKPNFELLCLKADQLLKGGCFV